MNPTRLPVCPPRPALRPRVLGFALALAVPLGGATTASAQDLLSAVPEDVFIVTASYPNPERQFLQDYWDEVWESFEATGVLEEVIDLALQNVGDEQKEQIGTFQTRLEELCGGVDWSVFREGEVVFAERLMEPLVHGGKNVMSGPPDMVLLVRTDEERTRRNFDGLASMVTGIVHDVGKLTGTDLQVGRSEEGSTEFVTFDPFQVVPDAPSFELAVGRRGDVLVLTLGQTIRSQVAALLAGKGDQRSIADSASFQRALEHAPRPEDGFEFVDMKNLRNGIEKIFSRLMEAAASESGRGAGPGDLIVNDRKNDEANALTRKAYQAYQKGDYAEALRLSQEAHEKDATDSVVMYNLACFHALQKHPEEALQWLDRAVEGGFYAPEKISEDSDLDSLRENPRFAELLVRARELAEGFYEPEPAEPSSHLSIAKLIFQRVLDTLGMFDHSLTVRHTEGHSMYEDSFTVLAPGAQENPFYAVINTPSMDSFARFLPKETTAFDVNGGFDFDALYDFLLGAVAEVGEPGQQLLEQWQAWQEQMDFDLREDVLALLGTGFVNASFELNGKGQSVFMMAVRQEEQVSAYVSQGLQMLPGLISEAAKKNPMAGMLALSITPTKGLEGFHDIASGMSQERAVVGVADGWLVFASSADAVRLIRATAAGEHPNVLENESLIARALVPEGAAQAVSFQDKRSTGEDLATGLRMVSMFGPMSVASIPEPEARRMIGKVFLLMGKLAPVAQRVDFYDSTANCTTFDGKAWHVRSVTHYVAPAGDPSSAEKDDRVGVVSHD